MMPFLIYLLKVTVCSGLLTGYYYIALRNRAFHQWNRFYLLATVLLSLTVPLLTFTIFHSGEDKSAAIQLLETVGSGDAYVVFVASNNTPPISLEQGGALLYGAVSLVILGSLLLSLLKVWALIKKHAVQSIDDVQFINADVQGTPFSFFRYIFWNPSIDLQSENGNRIFRHELAHVRERHSLDKLLLQVVLVLFWCNPVFWIIRYELRMIHEFIADRKALDQQDASALAAMILQAAYPTRYNHLINSFFNQSIKRRLHMLAKNQSPRLSYVSRILFLPLAASLVLAFSVRTQPVVTNNDPTPTRTASVQSPGSILQTAVQAAQQPAGSAVKGSTAAGSDTAHKEFNGLVIVDGKEYKEGLNSIDPKTIQSINVLKGAAATNKYGEKGKNGVIEITLKKSLNNFTGLVMVDGVEYKEDIKKLDPSTIQSINVLKGAAATEKYGERGKDGVIEITREPSSTGGSTADTIKPKTATMPVADQEEEHAHFPGGVPEWRNFLQKTLDASVPVVKGAPEGTYTVMTQLLIEADGTISEIKPLTTHGYGMEEEVVRTFKLSPRWVPGRKDGRPVRSYHKQPITFVIAADGKPTETPPVTLKSGATLTVAQLQSVPFGLLIKPENGDYKIPKLNTSVPAAELKINGAFTTGDNKGEVHEVTFSGEQPNESIRRLIASVQSGDIITIDKRYGTTKDGQEFKMPSLVYFIK